MKGVEQQYRSSEEYHEAWKMKARDLLAKSEFRKRKITMRVSAAAAGPADCHQFMHGQGGSCVMVAPNGMEHPLHDRRTQL